VTAAPSAVDAPLTSNTLPLMRFSSTYQAVVSTVAADAGAVTTVSSPPTNATANAAATPARHRRRHLAARANPTTDIASFLSSRPTRCVTGNIFRGRSAQEYGLIQLLPARRQTWFFLVVRALAGSQVHWWTSAPTAVEISLTSTHLPLCTATSW